MIAAAQKASSFETWTSRGGSREEQTCHMYLVHNVLVILKCHKYCVYNCDYLVRFLVWKVIFNPISILCFPTPENGYFPSAEWPVLPETIVWPTWGWTQNVGHTLVIKMHDAWTLVNNPVFPSSRLWWPDQFAAWKWYWWEYSGMIWSDNFKNISKTGLWWWWY